MSLDNNAEAQFASGYNNVPTETPEPPKVEEKTPAAEVPAPAPDPMKEFAARLDKYEQGQNKLAGHIGGLTRSQQEIRETLAAAKAATKAVEDAPTQAQVQEAMNSPKEWADLSAAFPEWAIATEKIIDAKVSSLKPQAQFDQAAIDKIVAERVAGETATVRNEMIDTHLDSIVDGDWRATINSPAYAAWVAAQSAEVQALGESERMTDAAKLLRLFHASQIAKTEPTKQPSPRQKRLEAAVNPRSAGGHASTSSELDDFEAGYKG